MKFKLKLGRWQLILLIAVVAVVAALLVHRSKSSGTSGPGTMDSHAAQACGDFSDGYPKAKTKSSRLSLADKVTASSARSDNATIRDKAMAIGRNADDSTDWKASATALLDACHDAGFSG
ncbi:hypothetical protein [Actinoplanes sp. NPDC051411]|uniref:hypothetical protein n=1 Tax=Actinoplanes sp. NPDC051411 TaxID=3155522 RepID=UPI00342AC901